MRPRRATTEPRERTTQLGTPTAAPARAQHAPNGKPSNGSDPAQSAIENARNKHPSDYHADSAVDAMIRSLNEPDSARRDEHLRVGQIHATLSLRDAVLELAAVQRDIRDGRSATEGPHDG